MTDQPRRRADPVTDPNARFRPVHIRGEVVTRPSSVASPAIHSYLRHLRDQGLREVPEPLSITGDTEQLGFIDGVSGGGGWSHQRGDQGLASAARLLRRVHDAGADWVPPPGTVWAAPPVPGDDLVFCHGDPGPWNYVWRDREVVGLLDWDYLHPGPRVDDIAYALYWFVPLRSDEQARSWHHFPTVPDRRHRIRVFLDAYGDLPAFDVVDAVAARIRATSDLVRALAESGQEPQHTWVARGALDMHAAEAAWVEGYRSELD